MVAQGLDGWTAGGLRDAAPALPPGAELFIQAGAIVAEGAAPGAATRAAIEEILRRASEQAGLLVAGR